MFFHVIGLKEKEGQQHELDLIIQGGNEDFIRKFLAERGVVTVSIGEFKGDTRTFGNISVATKFENTDIWILTSGEDLEDKAYFFISLGLSIHFINFTNNPIPDGEMNDMIKSIVSKIFDENEQIKREKEEKEMKEKKKYSESAIDDTLKIINLEIDRMEQIMKSGSGIISGMDMKKMEDLCNEMKKIRLGTNFNKMASLILYAHELTKRAENEILSQDESKTFLIDKNSIATNVDFISELSAYNRISEKAIIQPNGLTTDESVRNILGINSVFLRLLIKDFSHTFEQSSIDDFFNIVTNSIEYIILIIIIVFSLLWLIEPIALGTDGFSLYLLPALGWMGLLIYLFNSLNFEGIVTKSTGFIVMAIIYWYGLVLLKGTFAL